jgi:type II secretory pathway pseudopilin PulG
MKLVLLLLLSLLLLTQVSATRPRVRRQRQRRRDAAAAQAAIIEMLQSAYQNANPEQQRLIAQQVQVWWDENQHHFHSPAPAAPANKSSWGPSEYFVFVFGGLLLGFGVCIGI